MPSEADHEDDFADFITPASSKESKTSDAQCPVCQTRVQESELIRHANQCIDLLSNDIEIPSPPPSPPLTQPPSIQPPPRTIKPNPIAEDIPISQWLQSIGLKKYAPNILRANLRTLSDLRQAPPTDNFLKETCQISAMGARRKILSEIAALTKWTNLPSNGSRTRGQESVITSCASNNPVEGLPVQGETASKRKLWAIFEPGYCASSPSKVPTDKRARTLHHRASKKPRRHRPSQRVAGTSFTVDSFHAATSDPGCTTFFLTHFHSDHYGGLRRKTLPNGARVLCSAVTAKLVKDFLHIPDAFLRVLPVGEKVDVPDSGLLGSAASGASVWLFDANHCPGAVVMLFYVWRTKRYILHSGDCRFDPRVFEKHGKLVDIVRAGLLDYLHLDTTYCDPKYVFPHQDTILAKVVAAARKENDRTRGQCIFFFGTYSIGKEKVFLAVAEALNLKIFASPRKRSILKCLHLGPSLTDRLVERANEARVHVVSMFDIGPERLGNYALRNSLNRSFIGRGLAIVFHPTGWSFRGGSEGLRMINRMDDQAMLYHVAYSEHSSFEELCAFVNWAKPARLIPTVNARSMEHAQELCRLLGHVDKSLRSVG